MKTIAPDCQLAIGPANFAGQAFYWAQAVTRYLGVPAYSFSNRAAVLPGFGRGGFQFPAHHTLPHHRTTTSWGKRLRIDRLLNDVTHLAADGFLPLFGRLDHSHIGADLLRLRTLGLEVALIAHGSDVRDPDVHMARYSSSYFRDAPEDWVELMRSRSRLNRDTARDAGAPVFVSTPDLLLDLPTATWLPLTVDLAAWRSSRPAFSGGVPRVMHVPSRGIPPIKGSAYIDPVLRELHASGKIVYLRPERRRHVAMPTLVEQADIIVDQIQTGSYGVAAVEGMAAGRLVVGYLGADVKALLPEPPPIVDAEPAVFAEVMETILADVERYSASASSGPTYAERWHSGLASAQALTQFLGSWHPGRGRERTSTGDS